MIFVYFAYFFLFLMTAFYSYISFQPHLESHQTLPSPCCMLVFKDLDNLVSEILHFSGSLKHRVNFTKLNYINFFPFAKFTFKSTKTTKNKTKMSISERGKVYRSCQTEHCKRVQYSPQTCGHMPN